MCWFLDTESRRVTVPTAQVSHCYHYYYYGIFCSLYVQLFWALQIFMMNVSTIGRSSAWLLHPK